MVSSHAIKELLQFFHVTLFLWDDTFDKNFPMGTIYCSRKIHRSALDINHNVKVISSNILVNLCHSINRSILNHITTLLKYGY